MKLRITSAALLVAVLMAFVVAPRAASAARPSAGPVSLPVTGTLPDGGTFTGTITDLALSLNDAGDLVLDGVLNGTATSATGVVTQITNQAFSVVAGLTNADGGKCDILFLDLGPIFLDLLGLQVDLSQIVLDIDAVPGAGNLLGNLLCAVAGLLDGNGIGGLLNLLDRINDLLDG